MRGAFGFFRPMNSAQTLELGFAKALNADGDTVHARPLVFDKAVGFDGARVGFHGNLHVSGQRQTCANAVQQGLHRRAGEQARRPAADENGLHFTSLRIGDVSV